MKLTENKESRNPAYIDNPIEQKLNQKMSKIEVKIDYKSHTETILKNGKGDTFTFNPQKYEELQDFLSGCNKSLIEEKEEENLILRELYTMLIETSPGVRARSVDEAIELFKKANLKLKQNI